MPNYNVNRPRVDCSVFPAIVGHGDQRGNAEFKLRHEGAQRCCLVTLYDAHALGELSDCVPCRRCARTWTRDHNGWYAVMDQRRKKIARVGNTPNRPRPRGLISMREVHRRRKARERGEAPPLDCA